MAPHSNSLQTLSPPDAAVLYDIHSSLSQLVDDKRSPELRMPEI